MFDWRPRFGLLSQAKAEHSTCFKDFNQSLCNETGGGYTAIWEDLRSSVPLF